MNDPSATPVDIDEQRNWLNDYRVKAAASWSEIAKRINIPAGTISQFGAASYKGDNDKIAQALYRFRQTLAQQAALTIDAPEAPHFFESETSKQLVTMLAFAQRGRIVVAALGPGLGKTKTAAHYQACTTNVFRATMSPSTAGVNNMQIEVLESLGEKNPVGTPQKLSRRIREIVSNLRGALIIIDEAQHCSEKALEEIRSWHDATGVGIALFGNVGVLQRLEGGDRRGAFAQLFSRVSLKVVRALPLHLDVDAMAHAWGIFAEDLIAYLRKICMTPGGLRSGTMALELAYMVAASNKRDLAVSDLQDAWTQLSSRTVLA